MPETFGEGYSIFTPVPLLQAHWRALISGGPRRSFFLREKVLTLN